MTTEPVDPLDDPSLGHLFELTATSRGVHTVLGSDTFVEADWWGAPWRLRTRAFDLPTALRNAANEPLHAWQGIDDGDGWAQCVVCGSPDVTAFGMVPHFEPPHAGYRVAWCNAPRCRADHATTYSFDAMRRPS